MRLLDSLCLDLPSDILDVLLESLDLTSLMPLPSRPLVYVTLQELFVSAELSLVFLHLLILVHEIHLHKSENKY